MTSTETQQEDAIAFLRTHASCGPSVAQDVIRTHGALVFLHETEALKIKRAVTYDYLDFSTRALREKMLRRELELNQPSAPWLYRDVVALTREADGGLTFDGNGPVVEWVLRMTRFPVAAELSVVADHGLFDALLADLLGRSIAQYHHDAKPSSADGRILIREIIDELGRVLGTMHAQLGAGLVGDFLAACDRMLAQVGGVLANRSQAGWVRRCHGDLHLRNIVLWDGVPTPFDALEFDERLGTCDVLYDLAFLLMDLSHRKLDAAANMVLNAYLLQSGTDDHFGGLAALPLFLAIRAGIRAMVDVQTAAVHDDGADGMIADARAFLRQALGFLAPVAPQLIALGGLSGSGKTTLARQIAPRIGSFPGAVHLRSDLERKAFFKVQPLQKLPVDAYRAEVSDKVYQIMRTKARLALLAGQAVILDAVHGTADERRMAARIAADTGCAFHGFWLDAQTSIRVERVAQRALDASDADTQVALRQTGLQTGAIDWHRLDAAQSLEHLVAAVLEMLQAAPPARK